MPIRAQPALPVVLCIVMCLGMLFGCKTATYPQATSEVSRTSQAVAEAWLESTSEFQRKILVDKAVDAKEYQAALNAGIQCLQQAGYGVSGPQHLPDGIRMDFIVYESTPQPSETPTTAGRMPVAMSEAWARCRMDFYAAVEGVWLAQHITPAGAEVSAEGVLVACLDANDVSGYVVGMADHELATILVDEDATIAAWACRERFLIESGRLAIWPPVGP